MQTNILKKLHGLLLSQFFNTVLIRKGIVIIVSYPASWHSLMIAVNTVDVPHSMVGSSSSTINTLCNVQPSLICMQSHLLCNSHMHSI